MAWTYVTKAIVANLFSISTDALEDEWSEWAEALISEHMGYSYVGTTQTVSSEKHDGDGTPFLFVKYPPIVSVTSIDVGTNSPTAITSTSYKVYDHYIQLVNDPTTELSMASSRYNTIFPVGVQNITITYVSGLASVPKIVEFTAAQMIAEIAKFYQRGGADNAQRYTPTNDTKGRPSGVVTQKGLTATLRGIMENNLRKRVIALG